MDGIIAIIAAAIFFWLGYGEGKRANKPLKYKWSCMEPGCTFHMASDDMNMTLAFADAHTEQKHGGSHDTASA